MKQSVILAGLAAAFASANAHGPKHNHVNNHARRDIAYTTTVTTVTDIDYVTLLPGQPAPLENKAPVVAGQGAVGNQGAAGGAGGPVGAGAGAGAAIQVQAASTTSSSTTAAPVVQPPAPSNNAPVNNQPVQAAAVNNPPATPAANTPAPIGGDIPVPSITDPSKCPLTPPEVYQNCVNSAQGYINSMQKASDYAYASTNGRQTGAPTGPPVNPTVSAPYQPGTSQPVAPGFVRPGPDGCADTFMTYYGGQGGTGSCGYPISDSNNTIAIAAAFQPKCNQAMKIYINGATEPIEAIVADTCPACGADGHVDASQDWAQAVAGPNLVRDGHVPIKYCWS